jgi:hypothetical protein
VPDRVQTICLIHLPLSKSPLPPFPSIRPQVLALSVRGPAILCCSECSAQVRCPPPHSEGCCSYSERSPGVALTDVTSQEVCP